jgi:hypothetical protein
METDSNACIAIAKTATPTLIKDPATQPNVNYLFKIVLLKQDAETTIVNCDDAWEIKCQKDSAGCSDGSGGLKAEVCGHINKLFPDGKISRSENFELKETGTHPNGFELPSGQNGYTLTNNFKLEVECKTKDEKGEEKTETQSKQAQARTCVGGECGTGLCFPTDGAIGQMAFCGYESSCTSHTNADAVDVPAPLGTPVYAPFSGEYTYSTKSVINKFTKRSALDCVINSSKYTAYDGVGYNFNFNHLRMDTCTSRPIGQAIHYEQGEIIGYINSTGNSSGNHLHFQVAPKGSKGNSNLDKLYKLTLNRGVKMSHTYCVD